MSPTAAHGHDFTVTRTLVLVKSGGDFSVEMTCDLDALLLGAGSGHPPEALVETIAALPEEERRRRIERLRGSFERRVRLRFDGEPTPFTVTFPDRLERPTQPDEPPTYLGITARLRGRVPPEAQTFTFWASRAIGGIELAVVVLERDLIVRQPLAAGDESRPVALLGGTDGVGWGGRLLDYLRLGFIHIIPRGYDHILFVLGLYLLGSGWRPLLLQVTAFTLAHTVTLGLATHGVVSLPAAVVEPLIALSIAWVALENLWAREVKVWRLGVVFGFGLLHGLGFAGVLAELGMPEGGTLPALVGFNLGVELGQLAVLALAFAASGWWREREWYVPRLAIPLSLGIAACGVVLAALRLIP